MEKIMIDDAVKAFLADTPFGVSSGADTSEVTLDTDA